MQKNSETTAYRKQLRERIMTSAMAMFRKRGVKSVKMDDIATALSVSKRTLYEIFENKEILLYEGLRFEHESHLRDVRDFVETHHANVMDILLAFYHFQVEEFSQVSPDFFADLHRYPMVLQYLRNEDERNKENAKDFFLRGIEEGFFRPDVNYDIVARVSKMGINGAMESKMFDEYSLSDIFSNMIMVFFRGICTPKGLEVLDRFEIDSSSL